MGNNLDKLENILDHEEAIINEFKHLLDKEGKELIETLQLIRYIKFSSISILNRIKNFETFVNAAKNSRHWGGKNPDYTIKNIEKRKEDIMKQIEEVDGTVNKIISEQKHELRLDKFSERLLKNAKKTLNKVDYSLLKQP